MARVGADLRRSNARTARAHVAQLKRHAEKLMHQTGGLGYRLRVLLPHAHSRVQRQYLSLVVKALTAQWWEARSLAHLADLIWWDPFMLSPRDCQEMERWQRSAQTSAVSALAYSREAGRMKERFPNSFRYLSVSGHG